MDDLELTKSNTKTKRAVDVQSPALCSVCSTSESKYTCPGCGRKTCSLTCVQEHKITFTCNGKRDRTNFVKRGDLSYKTLVSDYKLLEEIERIDDVARRSQPPAPRRQLPAYLKSLVYQAKCRNVTLHLVAPGMKKRKENTTRYDGKSKVLYWRVEWRFQSKENGEILQVTHTARMPERSIIQESLDDNLGSLKKDIQNNMQIGRIYMKQEGIPADQACLYLVDPAQPLADFLQGKYIIEFPIFYVIVKT